MFEIKHLENWLKYCFDFNPFSAGTFHCFHNRGSISQLSKTTHLSSSLLKTFLSSAHSAVVVVREDPVEKGLTFGDPNILCVILLDFGNVFCASNY